MILNLGLTRSSGLTLPRTGLIFYAKAPGMVDSIGPSAVTMYSPCGTSDGSSYISMTAIVGTETAINGGTAEPTVSAGRITFGAGTIFNVRLNSGIIIPVCEGSGAKTYGYNSSGAVYIGTITATSLYAFWDGTQTSYHHAFYHGFSERTNAVIYSNNLASAPWSAVSGAIVALDAVGINGEPNTASTITDANGTAYAYFQQRFNVGLSNKTHTFAVWFKKDSDETRFPGVYIYYSGGSAKGGWVRISTKTGVMFSDSASKSAGVLSEVISVGDFWRVLISLPDNGTNTVHDLRIWPANSSDNINQSVSAVGSCIVGQTEAHPNNSIANVKLIDAPITEATAYYGRQPANPITGLDVIGLAPQYSRNLLRAISISISYSAELGGIDDGTFFSGETPNVVGYTSLIKLRGPKWFFSDDKGLAAYGVDQVGVALNRIKKWFSIPSYLLAGSVFHADFQNSRFFWRDKEQEIGALQDSNGLKFLDTGIDFSGVVSLVFDFELDQSGPPSGVIFSLASAYPGDRVEVTAYSNGVDMGLRVYCSPPGIYEPLMQTSKIAETSGNAVGGGLHRMVLHVKNGVLLGYQPDNGDYRESSLTVGSLKAPARIGLLCGANAAYAPTIGSSAITLHRVTISNKELSADYIKEIGESGTSLPIHVIGDSFINSYWFINELMLATKSMQYIGFSQDGVGGTTLTQQAVRFAANNVKWHDSTLVIYEGGLDGTAADAIAAIDSMVATLTHNRWIMLEPAPHSDMYIGSGARTDWEARCSAIKAHLGNRWINTLSVVQAAGDDSPEDNTEIAKGLWPLSLKISTSDFHPNAAGNIVMAGIVKTALQGFGWLPFD